MKWFVAALAFFFLSYLLTPAVSVQNGDVKLVGGDGSHSGRLEVYRNTSWTSVCYDYNSPDAILAVGLVVCRQIGFYRLLEIGPVKDLDFPQGNHKDKLVNPVCTPASDPANSPEHIFRCLFIGGTCPHEDDIGIICSEDAREDTPYDTMVMLDGDKTGAASISSGYSMVYLNDNWGPVCNMDQNAADSFCRQLSYTNAVAVVEGNGTGFILPEPVLSHFDCAGESYQCLRKCFSYPKADSDFNPVCPIDVYSHVTCTYSSDVPGEILDTFGTKGRCTSRSHGGAAAAGIIVALLMVIIGAAITAAVCFFVPGCYFHRGSRGSFSPGNPKYDAI